MAIFAGRSLAVEGRLSSMASHCNPWTLGLEAASVRDAQPGGCGMRADSEWPWVRGALVLVLLAAAGLKAHELLTVPAAALPLPWGWSVALVQFELAAACWILLAPSPRWAWWGALVMFGVFAVAAATKWASGAADCGCFGRLPTRPWQSLLVDLAALALLWVVRGNGTRRVPATVAGTLRVPSAILSLPPGEGRGKGRPRRLARLLPFAVTWLLLALPLTAALAAFRPGGARAPGLIGGAGNLMVLEPEKWLGQRWPLLGYIDRGAELSAGRWQVVLYHHECPKCQALLAKLAATPESLPLPVGEGRGEGAAAARPRLALLELPPFGEFVGARPENAVRAQLSTAKEWFVETPVMLALDEEVVTDSRIANRAGGERGGVSPQTENTTGPN